MQTVTLVIHIILGLALVGVVLMQRSEGGALGIGGGGGGGGLLSGRGAAGALVRTTIIVGSLFIITSLTLTTIAARTGQSTSIAEDRVELLDLNESGATNNLTGPLDIRGALNLGADVEPTEAASDALDLGAESTDERVEGVTDADQGATFDVADAAMPEDDVQ